MLFERANGQQKTLFLLYSLCVVKSVFLQVDACINLRIAVSIHIFMFKNKTYFYLLDPPVVGSVPFVLVKSPVLLLKSSKLLSYIPTLAY